MPATFALEIAERGVQFQHPTILRVIWNGDFSLISHEMRKMQLLIVRFFEDVSIAMDLQEERYADTSISETNHSFGLSMVLMSPH